MMKPVLAPLALALTLLAVPAHAQNWGALATISDTMGVSDSRICIGEASRGDIGCPSFAPTISPTGRINATAGLTVDSISLTTTGITWGYLGSNRSYLPNLTAAQVSATAISTTAVQIASTTTALACTGTNAGTLRYNSSNTALELCTGSGWQAMGVGIPAGTISAFASTTCPTGWSEYTPARGRFLRGIDNGAGNDPSGTRVPGDIQEDILKAHTHTIFTQNTNSNDGSGYAQTGTASTNNHSYATSSSGGDETRPKNVAVTYCQFNGTSNGWNNPLPGGNISATNLDVSGGITASGRPYPWRWSTRSNGELYFGTTTWADVPGATITFTLPVPADVMIQFDGAVTAKQANIHCSLGFNLNAALQGDAIYGDVITMGSDGGSDAAWWNSVSRSRWWSLPAGTHTVKIQGRSSPAASNADRCQVRNNDYSRLTLTVMAYPTQ